MLVLHNNADGNFSDFSATLCNSPFLSLKGIIVENIQFTEEVLSRLKQLTENHRFKNIAFINSVPTTLLDKFSNDFLSYKVMKNLRYLSLDNTTGINIDNLAKQIMNLNILSLSAESRTF